MPRDKKATFKSYVGNNDAGSTDGKVRKTSLMLWVSRLYPGLFDSVSGSWDLGGPVTEGERIGFSREGLILLLFYGCLWFFSAAT